MKTITKTLVLVTGLGVGLAATGALLAHGPNGYMGGPGMMNGGYGNPTMMQQGYGGGHPMGYGNSGIMGGPGMMNGGYGNPGMMQQGSGTQSPMGRGMMGGSGMMQGGTMGPGMMGQMGANATENLNSVKTELGITQDQEAAWNDYATALQGHVALGQASHQAMWSSQGEGVGASHNNLRQAMWESREKVGNAQKNLRAVLTPAQQQKAQALLGQGCFG
jgi:hypothetical protein